MSRLLMVSAIAASPCFADGGIPQLTLDPVNVKQEGVVSFSILSLGSESRFDFSGPQYLVGQTEDGMFRLYVDVDSIQQVRFNSFTFTAYLAELGAGGRKTYKFQITGNPTGSFRDTPVRASFHVKRLTTNATGVILMPAYNATKTDLLETEEQKEPGYVSISGGSPVQVRLGNVPDAMGISVTNVAVSESCPKCWRRISSTVNDKNPIGIEPGSNATLPIDLLPNSIPALMQGALMIKPDVPHDTLMLTVTYHTVPGGADRKQTVPFKIRFGPGLLGLALALCAGIALGLAARYLLTGKLGKDNEGALHAILSALVLALIAEFVGVMMTAYGNSKLVLFDLDIDPRQLFPAFILAILVSGGAAVVSWMKGMFAKTP
ncbi:MAG: hypothetical protein WBL63_26005 [Candidatus Acidiferrum sp.]